MLVAKFFLYLSIHISSIQMSTKTGTSSIWFHFRNSRLHNSNLDFKGKKKVTLSNPKGK